MNPELTRAHTIIKGVAFYGSAATSVHLGNSRIPVQHPSSYGFKRASAAIGERFDLPMMAAVKVVLPLIRNFGTLGGNLDQVAGKWRAGGCCLAS